MSSWALPLTGGVKLCSGGSPDLGLGLLTWKSFLQSLIMCDRPWVAAMFSPRSLGPGRPTRLRLLLILEGRGGEDGALAQDNMDDRLASSSPHPNTNQHKITSTL